MSLLEMICKELGVEVGEKWLGDDGYEHQISKKGTLRTYIQQGASVERCEISNELWLDIVAGELKPVWEPQKGETYYTPYINALNHSEVYIPETWGKDRWYDQVMWARCMVFKTKQEAINCANEMIMLAKQGI